MGFCSNNMRNRVKEKKGTCQSGASVEKSALSKENGATDHATRDVREEKPGGGGTGDVETFILEKKNVGKKECTSRCRGWQRRNRGN